MDIIFNKQKKAFIYAFNSFLIFNNKHYAVITILTNFQNIKFNKKKIFAYKRTQFTII